MSKKHYYWLRLSILPMLLIIVYFLTTVQSANAANSHWARWQIKVSFPQDIMDMNLIIQRGYTDSNGHPHLIVEETIPITCQSIGNPTITNEQAVFDGSSYFQCDIPSIKQEVSQMPGGMILPDACPAKRPYITAALTLEDNPIQPKLSNPLFFREGIVNDVSFSLPLNAANQQARIETLFGQKFARSDIFTPSLTGNDVQARYRRLATPQIRFGPIFNVDGLNLASTPSTISGSIEFSTLESTVYLGFSPVSKEYFEGTLEELEFDPYCDGV